MNDDLVVQALIALFWIGCAILLIIGVIIYACLYGIAVILFIAWIAFDYSPNMWEIILIWVFLGSGFVVAGGVNQTLGSND